MKNKLALHGGTPVRDTILPYGRQEISEDDIYAVAKVLRSDWLTTGPKVGEFEEQFAAFVGANEAVAVSNGTAALHAALYALGVGDGDEVIVTPMTFAASANAAVYLGATPVFSDVDAETLLLDPEKIEEKITSKTKAIVAVDYAGQPCDYDAIYNIANRHGVAVLDDACHAIGGHYKEQSVGTLADMNTFSLHPVKHMTTGEGGVITTNNSEFARQMRVFRNHGITTDHRQRSERGGFFYEMVDVGYNYRITDFQCALGMSQLSRLALWVEKRQAIARWYDRAFQEVSAVAPLAVRLDVSHAYHLYMVQFDLNGLRVDRAEIFQALRAEGIGVNVHYIPVHFHPFYRKNFNTKEGLCPVAEAAYERLITLPIFPQMNKSDMEDVVTAVQKVVEAYKR